MTPSMNTDKLNRRSFGKTIAGTLAPLAVGISSTQSHQTESRPPNIILMICDDLGYGDLHCYGSRLNTPNLDRMAREGVRFTRHNTAHPICSASRAALLTGRYACRSHTEGAYGPNSRTGMDLDEKTLADILRPAHYRSMCIGKWHLGYPSPYLPTERGFDAFFGVPWSVDMNPLPLLRNTKVIDDAKSGPFFLYLAYSYPHDPPRASPRFRGHSKLGHQADAIEEIDWSVGEILAAVRRNGLDRNTLLIFTSDHRPWFQGNPGPLRGRKSTTFEGGERVPFLARWSGTIPAGRTIDEWGCHLDIVPTVASICGAQLPDKHYDGLDISKLLKGEATSLHRGTMLYFAVSPHQQILECARKGSWKLRIAQGTGEIYINDWLGGSCGPKKHFLLPRPELYNLDLDPAESYNAATEYPEIVKEIQQDIEALIPTFPKNVVKAYAELKANPGSPLTPPGAAARSRDLTAPPWIWVPNSRRTTN